jgi:hypothetical protein
LTANFGKAAPWLAWVVGAVKYTATSTAPGLQFRSQFLVNTQQQSKKVEVLQYGVAHFCGL